MACLSFKTVCKGKALLFFVTVLGLNAQNYTATTTSSPLTESHTSAYTTALATASSPLTESQTSTPAIASATTSSPSTESQTSASTTPATISSLSTKSQTSAPTSAPAGTNSSSNDSQTSVSTASGSTSYSSNMSQTSAPTTPASTSSSSTKSQTSVPTVTTTAPASTNSSSNESQTSVSSAPASTSSSSNTSQTSAPTTAPASTNSSSNTSQTSAPTTAPANTSSSSTEFQTSVPTTAPASTNSSSTKSLTSAPTVAPASTSSSSTAPASTNSSSIESQTTGSSASLMIVGEVFGVVCSLFGVMLIFFFYLRRKNKKKCPDIRVHTISNKINIALRIEDYEDYFKQKHKDSNCGFAEEYEELKTVGTAQPKNTALANENKPKNRYINVLPYDASRVKLSVCGSPFDDYINANYIPGYNSRKEFIAAQGPLPFTVNDFWRMVWEKNICTIVMLTKCNEMGRVKCETYWPSGTNQYQNISVTTTSETELESWTIRDFGIKNVKTAETRNIRQFHFTAWPDHGVPETTEVLIDFRHLVREYMDQYLCHCPTLVHCSAGVGRTGTFIAIDHLLFQIERDSMVDIYGIVNDMRMHRPLMVQTEEQYVYLHQCAYDIIRSRTGTNVDLIYQNVAAATIYQNVDYQKR